MSEARREDRELFDAWRGGDSRAGRELFARHYRSVSRFFRTKAPGSEEDLAQRTFEACLRYKDGIVDGQRFRPYLLTIARNELYDHFKRITRRPVSPLTTSIGAFAMGATSRYDRAESQHRLHLALRSLPLDLQTAIELHYWEELSTSELGRVLGVPQGTVKTRLRRARQQLLQSLDTSEEADLEGQLRTLGGPP